MKKIIILTNIIYIILSIVNPIFAEENYLRVDKVSKNLRCLICQGQSIYDSQSDFALSVKDLIKEKIDEGQNDEEIYNYLKIKYGDWILYEPRLDKKTVLLWLLPLILFVFGGLLIFRKVFIKLDKINNDKTL